MCDCSSSHQGHVPLSDFITDCAHLKQMRLLFGFTQFVICQKTLLLGYNWEWALEELISKEDRT